MKISAIVAWWTISCNWIWSKLTELQKYHDYADAQCWFSQHQTNFASLKMGITKTKGFARKAKRVMQIYESQFRVDVHDYASKVFQGFIMRLLIASNIVCSLCVLGCVLWWILEYRGGFDFHRWYTESDGMERKFKHRINSHILFSVLSLSLFYPLSNAARILFFTGKNRSFEFALHVCSAVSFLLGIVEIANNDFTFNPIIQRNAKPDMNFHLIFCLPVTIFMFLLLIALIAQIIKKFYKDAQALTILKAILNFFSSMLLFNYIERYVALGGFVASLTGYFTYTSLITTAYEFDSTHVFDDEIEYCLNDSGEENEFMLTRKIQMEDQKNLCVSESYAINLIFLVTTGSFLIGYIITVYEHKAMFHPPNVITYRRYHKNFDELANHVRMLAAKDNKSKENVGRRNSVSSEVHIDEIDV